MNNIKCEMFINKLHEFNTINFYRYGFNNKMITFNIINNPIPILKLRCYTYNNQEELELYEYGINYIINNKIGKYSHLEIHPFLYDTINLYFNIIDINILLQLV